MRRILNVNDGWSFEKEGAVRTVSLPHTWNNVDGQDGGNDYYRGVCTYRKEFVLNDLKADEEAYLCFDGAAMTAHVLANSEEVKVHEGGYARFYAPLTEAFRGAEDGRVQVEVKVDNLQNYVYPQSADFTFYGGLYRDVTLVRLPKTHFSLADGGPGVSVTATADGKVSLKAKVDGAEDTHPSVSFRIYEEFAIEENRGPAAEGGADVENDNAELELKVKRPHLWEGLENPYLYTLKALLFSEGGDVLDEVTLRFGFRTFEIDAQKGFLLNGRPYPLRGVSRHQDRRGAGNALTEAMHEEDMELILDIGANFVRLAHYQHAQKFYDLCDENGIICWAEIPYITMHMDEGRDNTLSQMRELVVQNRHHASICVWGLSNEITAASKVTEELLENHRALNDLCHELDPSRKTTMANVFMLETDSPLLQIPDTNAYNLYFGWYLGELTENEEFFDTFHAKYPDMPMGFSEYGADANRRFHSSSPEKGDYTEEYQCVYHEHMLRMIEERPWLWCTAVWNMFDFAADGRDEGGEHGLNQKGLVSFDRKEKKDAFYAYKACWSIDPFVHLCGRAFANRTGENTTVKVYTNQPEVTLYVNGQEFEKQEGSHFFTFENIPLSAKTEIKAVAGGSGAVIMAYGFDDPILSGRMDEKLSDTMVLHRVVEEDPSYRLEAKDESGVRNWFEDIVIDPGCYSVDDKISDLMANPQASAILGPLMAGMAASRGSVAQDVSANNPVLQQMIGKMKLSATLKMAKDAISEEQVRELNKALQQIPKA